MATKAKTLGGVTDGMYEIREKRRTIAAEDAELKAQYDALETELIDLLDKQATTKCAGNKAGASIGKSTQFEWTGEDGWDAFMAYVAKNKLFHLVQRRVAVPACRELIAKKGKLPGLLPYNKRVINLRTL